MTILAPIAVVLAGALIYLYFATPSFTARAQLIIDPRIPEQIRSQTRDSVLSLDTAQLESGIAVLRSERIASMAATALDLRTAADLGTQPSPLARFLDLFRGRADELSSSTEAGASLADSHLLAEQIAAGLDVRRSGLSYAIDVAFTSPNPVLAADIANAIAHAYIRDQLDARSQAARAGAEWLERRMAELRLQMNAAAKAVQQFKAKHDYRIFASPEGPATPQRADTGADRAPGGAARVVPSRTTLEELETAAQTYRRIYESFLEGFTESVQRQSFPVSETRILTPATPPLTKSQPRTTLILALAGLVGALFGFGGALVRHHLDRTVRSSRQMWNETGIECLGAIPAVRAATVSLRQRLSGLLGHPRRAGGQVSPTTPQRETTPRLRNCFQSIKTLIELRTREDSAHCIGITSVRPGESRGELAANIAALYAASGHRTLIMNTDTEADARRKGGEPVRATALKPLMQGAVKLERAIVPAAGSRADTLVIADMDVSASLSEAADASAMTLLLLDLLQSYNVIVVDLPPVLPVGNGLSLSTLLDGVIVTAEYGVTSLDQLAEAAHWLDTAQVRIIGSVIVQMPG